MAGAGTDDPRYADLAFLAAGLVVGLIPVVVVPRLTKGTEPAGR